MDQAAPQPIDPLAELHAACLAAGSQRAWALAHQVSVQYLSDVLLGRRPPGPSILAALGLRRTFERVAPGRAEDDREIAAQRIAEIERDPERVITPAALAERLARWEK